MNVFLSRERITVFAALSIAALLVSCSGEHSLPAPSGSASASNAALGKPRSGVRPMFSGASDIVQAAEASTKGTAVSCTFGKSPTPGDVIVFGVGFYPPASTITDPTGVTAINDTNTQEHDDYRVVQSNDSKTWTFTANATTYISLQCDEVSGVDTSNPIDAHGESSGNYQTWNTASVTPTTAGDLPIAFFGNGQKTTYTGLTPGWTGQQVATTYYPQFNISGPVTGLGAVQASLTLSGGAAYGGTALVLLRPAANTPKSQYVYNGCNVYSPGDWLTADLADSGGANSYVPTSIDPKSSALVSYLQSTYGTIGWYAPPAEIDNIASSSTPRYALSSGYTETDDPYGDDSSKTVPWKDKTFLTEDDSTTCTGSDCHTNELDTTNAPSGCVDYENYVYGALSDMISNNEFLGGSGYVHNLGHLFNDQYSTDAGRISVGGIPMMATTAWGEDETTYNNATCRATSSCFIPHIIGFLMPVNGYSESGVTAPAVGPGQTCSGYCTHELKVGARLILHASFTCPSASTNPQASLLCNTLKKYGMIYDDQVSDAGNHCTVNDYGNTGDCLYSLRLGRNADGSDPWSGDGCCGKNPTGDLDDILSPSGAHYMKISDFDVLNGGVAQ